MAVNAFDKKASVWFQVTKDKTTSQPSQVTIYKKGQKSLTVNFNWNTSNNYELSYTGNMALLQYWPDITPVLDLPNARPAYYDRNALIVGGDYDKELTSPFAYTDFLIYTVPDGRKAIIESAFMSINRTVLGDTPSIQLVCVGYYTPGNLQTGLINRLTILTLNVGDTLSFNIPQLITLNAGNLIRIQGQDVGASGKTEFIAGLKGTEFDA